MATPNQAVVKKQTNSRCFWLFFSVSYRIILLARVCNLFAKRATRKHEYRTIAVITNKQFFDWHACPFSVCRLQSGERGILSTAVVSVILIVMWCVHNFKHQFLKPKTFPFFSVVVMPRIKVMYACLSAVEMYEYEHTTMATKFFFVNDFMNDDDER